MIQQHWGGVRNRAILLLQVFGIDEWIYNEWKRKLCWHFGFAKQFSLSLDHPTMIFSTDLYAY